MHFNLVDSVLSCDEKKIVTIKNVTSAEEYLQDHFPKYPILPGVLMLEALVQSARLWVDQQSIYANQVNSPLIIQSVRNIKYATMVKPGESLRSEVELRKVTEEGFFEFIGKGYNTEALAVQGRFCLGQLK